MNSFVFEFELSRLEQTLADVRLRHPTRAEIEQGAGARELAALLDELHRLVSREEVQAWTYRRKQFELYALSAGFVICPAEDWSKLGLTLSLRWREAYLSGVWSSLQRQPEEVELTRVLAELLDGHSLQPLLGEDAGRDIDRWLASGQFLQAAESHCVSEASPLSSQLGRLKIQPDSVLARRMMLAMLLRGSAARLLAEPDQEFISALKALLKAEAEVLSSFRNYLIQLTVGQWDARRVLADYILPYLAEHPRLKERLLAELPDSKRDELWQRLIRISVERAFAKDDNNDRVRFWLQFQRHLQREVMAIRPESGYDEAYAFNFGKFGVIEFYPIGAAYFYHPDDFARITARTPRRIEDLKQFKDVPNYFDVYQGYNRFIHLGDWMNRHYYTVAKLLR